MIPSTNGLPTPLASIDELLEDSSTLEKPVKVFVGHNLGHRSYLMILPMHEFFGMSEVANDPGRDGETVAQRKLDPVHAQKLAVYILKGLVSGAIQYRQDRDLEVSPELSSIMSKLGPQPYMGLQPIVANIRDCDVRGRDIKGDRLTCSKSGETAAFKIFLGQRHVLWVIDGQHRRRAMQIVFDFLEGLRNSRAYPKKSNLFSEKDGEPLTPGELKAWEECFERARTYFTVAVEVHVGLRTDEERQLFHDLNRLGKKVDTNLALQFDNSNPVNIFIKHELVENLGIGVVEADAKLWSDDDGRIARKDLVSVNAILLLNKTNINGATPQVLEGRAETAVRFWQAVQEIPGWGEERAREKTVAAQPVVLKALAKLVFDFEFSNRKPSNGVELCGRLLDSLDQIELEHSNPLWRYYEMDPAEREKEFPGLEAYLPDDQSGNRDIGSFQGGFMRFGAKHNDIYPILADMIRWKLRLPSRRTADAPLQIAA